MKIQKMCETCSAPFMVERKYVNRGNGRFCSRSCKSTGRFADPNRYAGGKTCTQCQKLKPLCEFSQSVTSGRKRPNSWCKACLNSYNTQKYQTDPSVLQKTKERRKDVKERTRQFFIDLLQQSCCMDCGEKDIVVLDFDHRDPKKKSFNLSEATSSGGISVARIKAEIEKCDIVCANCHRRRTAKQFGYYRILVPERGIEPLTRTLSTCRSTD